jgi:hypothetical protein
MTATTLPDFATSDFAGGDFAAGNLNDKFADMRQGIFADMEACFRAAPELANGGNTQLAWQRLYTAALLDVAATLAVDTGMTGDQLTAIFAESYQRANTAAPRFG